MKLFILLVILFFIIFTKNNQKSSDQTASKNSKQSANDAEAAKKIANDAHIQAVVNTASHKASENTAAAKTKQENAKKDYIQNPTQSNESKLDIANKLLKISENVQKKIQNVAIDMMTTINKVGQQIQLPSNKK